MMALSETIMLPHGPTPVLWRRSARSRRVSLRIDTRAAAVIIVLPARASRSAGLRLLTQHGEWVGVKLAALPPALVFADGGLVTLCDKPYTIRHVAGSRGGAWFEAETICATGDLVFLQRRVTDLLRAEAGRRLGMVVADVAAQIGLQPKRIAIRDTRSRWGSCSATGTVMFNWRLVMAPPAVQHYVVVHELAHLRHMDHGRHFWTLVAAFAPDMDRCIAWLKTHGGALMRAGAIPVVR